MATQAKQSAPKGEGKEDMRAKAMTMLGFAAFIVGMALAVIGGIWIQDSGTIVLILVIAGIIVGLFNITSKEMLPFLIAGIALVVAGSVGGSNAGFAPLNDIIGGFGDTINSIVGYIANFMVPAAIINAIKMLWQVARPG